MSVPGKLADYGSLPARSWLALQSLCVLYAVRLALWALPFGRVLAYAARPANRSQQIPDQAVGNAHRMAGSFEAASRFVPRATCLVRALALQVLLARKGIPSRTHLGVQKTNSTQLAGHAWLECEGEILMGGEAVGEIVPLSPGPGPGPSEGFIPEPRPVSRIARAVLLELRVYQWSKNLLVFVPAICAHRFGDGKVWMNCLIMFLVFGVAASGQYVFNDLVDVTADRAHPQKKSRPIAARELSVPWAVLLSALLVVLSLIGSASLPGNALGLVATYHGLAFTYSLYLKRVAIADVLVLPALYAVRVFAGGAVAGIEVSPWLLAFSLFLFFSLALIKRYSEIRCCQTEGDAASAGHPYQPGDLPILLLFGASSGTVAVLVLVFYVQSPQIWQMYSRPHALWLLCPLFMYWIGRFWLLAQRGAIRRDPVAHALADVNSYLVLALTVGVIVAAL